MERAEFDFVVIGSGPGGATVARDLSKDGAKVLVLERGSDAEIQGTMLQCMTTALVPGRNLHLTPELLALVHATILGGSSVLYYASAFEPPYAMFERHGVALKEDVEGVLSELPVAPLADELVGPAARRIMETAQAMGLEWAKRPKLAYQDKCRPNCDKCTMGCPYEAKWTSRMYIDEGRAHGLSIQTGARVTKLERANGRVKAVEFVQDGRRQRVSAEVVVVAAGGIGTPMLLRSAGLTNAGRDFFFDPLVVVSGSVDGLEAGREFPMVAGMYDPEAGYVIMDLSWPRWLFSLFTAEVLRFDRIPAQRHTLPIMVKIKDDLGGEITGAGGVRKRLTAADHSRLSGGAEIARKILQQAGARHIFRTWTMAVHPGGTAKIGDVVDSDLRTRYENLFVCDCSVIPESWGLPPTLTILALGRRLARHLASRN